ncbi:MAG: resA 4 [Mucilaginibacter sp.]|nr:resA 4 [Mucilaginibacter sp.]
MKQQSIIKKLTLSHLLNGFFAIIIVIIIINPSAKSLLIQSLMKVGFFQPDLSPKVRTDHVATLPELTLQSSDSKTLYLPDQKGKVIFMNFWATWCPPCIAEMPSINELRKKLKENKNIVFIMVDVDHDFSKSVPFMSKHGFGLPIYQANDVIPENLLGRSIPTTVVFDRNGKMVFRNEGSADYNNAKVLAYLMQLSR